MRWEIRREDGEAEPGERGQENDGPGWHSGLRLRFAALGEVEAAVTLRAGRLRIELQAAPAAGALLRQAAPRLQDALAAAGSELAALRIEDRRQEPGRRMNESLPSASSAPSPSPTPPDRTRRPWLPRAAAWWPSRSSNGPRKPASSSTNLRSSYRC
ncbi:flagellar hook-length control protein FliK [Massilia sp. Se16.2.3]|nr:flagellar hook-length control protein FliK [Massilia sp. Se16.2.3]